MEAHGIILFDGVCNLCNGAVQFVLKRDRKGYFRFGSLQSEAGEGLLKQYGIDPKLTDSMVLIENGKAYVRSAAALRILKHLKGPWPLFSSLLIIPAPVRNVVYDWIARNRYKWFGKKDACMLPRPEWQNRFI